MSKLFDALQRAADTQKHLLRILDAPDQPAAPRDAEPHAQPPEAQEAPGTGSGFRQPLRIEHLRLPASSPVFPFDGSASQASEQYRLLRTRIVHDVRAPQVLLVSSPGAADGKTITALNVAAALALKSDNTVLLIDADLRRPAIAPMLGIPTAPGLGGVLEGRCALEEAVVQIAEMPGLHVLPADVTTVNPTELLDSPRWAAACATIRLSFRYIVLDSPPIGSVADYDLLEKSSDGVIAVVRPDHTNRSLAFKAFETIPREKQLGFVVNCAKRWLFFKAPHPYYYYGEY